MKTCNCWLLTPEVILSNAANCNCRKFTRYSILATYVYLYYILVHIHLVEPKRMPCCLKMLMSTGAGPIKILQRKFYATQFFKHSDWIL